MSVGRSRPLVAHKSRLASRLLRWYAARGRDLPWRRRPGPYRTWISEIMLQQTRVETVIPYFARWMKRFPNVGSLARASEREVLRVWEGLGFYSRARNLHKAARLIVADLGGNLPSDAQQLQSLPGIGAYTAAAISSIAFGAQEIALDTNARRVLARLFAVRIPPASAPFDAKVRSAALEHLPRGRAGDFNQALMDLGSTICVAKNPRCARCPLVADCEAKRLDLQFSLPARRIKQPAPHRSLAAAVVQSNGRVLISPRPPNGLLGGLWEFPTVPAEPAEPRHRYASRLAAQVRTLYGLGIRRGRQLAVLKHAYSHFSVTVRAYECEVKDGATPRRMRWVRLNQLKEYPMGKVDRQIATALLSSPGRSEAKSG
jgi:A/G-specific adenine glycosylase